MAYIRSSPQQRKNGGINRITGNVNVGAALVGALDDVAQADKIHQRNKIMFGFKKKNDLELLKKSVITALKGVFDPEIPVNIYDLGLIYEIEINEKNQVHLQMTLTSPGCPVAQTFPSTVEQAVNQVEGVLDCTVELVWEPPWTQERMSEAARLELGIFY